MGGGMISPGGGAGGRDLTENVESEDDRSLEGRNGACEMRDRFVWRACIASC